MKNWNLSGNIAESIPKKLFKTKNVSFALKVAVLLCESLMMLHLPLICLKAFSSLLSKGVPD